MHRLTKFLGWVPPNATEVTGFYHLDVRIPDEYKYSLHNLLIRHGRSCKKCAGRAEATTPKKVKTELDEDGNPIKAKKMKVVWEGNGLMKERMVELGTDDEDANDDCVINHLVNRVRKPRRKPKSKGIKEEEADSQDGVNVDGDNGGPSDVAVTKVTIAIKDEPSEPQGLDPSIPAVAQQHGSGEKSKRKRRKAVKEEASEPQGLDPSIPTVAQQHKVGDKPKRQRKKTIEEVLEHQDDIEVYDLASDEDSDYMPHKVRVAKRHPAGRKPATKKGKEIPKPEDIAAGEHVLHNSPSADTDVPDLVADSGSDDHMGDSPDDGSPSSGSKSTSRKRAQSMRPPARTSKRAKSDARATAPQGGINDENFVVHDQLAEAKEVEEKD